MTPGPKIVKLMLCIKLKTKVLRADKFLKGGTMADDTKDTPEETEGGDAPSEFDANVELFSEYYEESLPAEKQSELKKLIADDERYAKA